MAVVTLHQLPTSRVTLHAAHPEMKSSVWQLPTDPEIMPEIIKLVRIKLECSACDLQCVNRLVRTRRRQLMQDKSCVRLQDIKTVAVVRNKNVSLIKYFPQICDEFAVVLDVRLIAGIVAQTADDHSILMRPLHSIAEHIPILLEVNDVRFPLRPDIT